MSLQLKGALQSADGFRLQVDLELPSVGVTALIGASGAGKSTLLRIIAGLARPDGFTLSFNGQRWDALPAHRRPISMTLQQPALFPHLTVAGNLRAVPGAKQIDAAAARFGLQDLMARKPATLSGGQQQRVALARAYLKPALLWLLDEPLSALDPLARAELAPMLRRLCRTLNRPVIYVTHALAEVLQIADHLVVMEAGEVIGAGSPETVAAQLDHPLSPLIDTGGILEAVFEAYDPESRLSTLRLGAQRLWVGGDLRDAPSPVRVQILARDLSLALERPAGTSILNILAVTLTGLAPAGDGALFAELDCAGQRLRARITRPSQANLGLKPGMALFALVKSTALDLHGA